MWRLDIGRVDMACGAPIVGCGFGSSIDGHSVLTALRPDTAVTAMP
jgi:hypothetical protein